MFQMDGATAGRSRTAEDATWPLARTQADSARGQLHPRRHWPGYAGRLATVRANVKLRDLNVAVRGDDERCIEVVASGLPLYHGAQLAVDITMRSAVTSSDEARPGAARVDGIVCINARADKEQKYAELLAGDQGLARARAREAPPNQARSAFLGLEEEMDQVAFRLLRKGVRHFFALRDWGAACRVWG